MFILERINKAIIDYRRSGGKFAIDSLQLGVKEANEIIPLVAECHPNCPYRFGFDSVAHSLNIQPYQITILLVESCIIINGK